jgi:lipopolysaccharide/colanic/teichoic acid biosynthesis glycosyltransferase
LFTSIDLILYKKGFKRVIDLVCSVVLLLVFLPVILIVSILLAIANRGQIFFLQERPGLNERIFKIFKFKTMTDKRDGNGRLLSDLDRLTTIGKIVRKLSIDELPQLINVLLGDMSLIGPRPLLVEYLSLYDECQRQRHSVRPGITGWAQVNGRNAITWQNKLKMDVWYANNLSFWLDFKILLLTFQKVVLAKDINADSQATTEKFKGNS